MKIISHSSEETKKLANHLAKNLPKGSILCLKGDLGSGKTTFVKGLADGLGIRSENVNSPTFVVMNIYKGKFPLYHFDLYRLETPQAINAIGYEEFFYGEGISVIEWSERLGKLMPRDYLEITFAHKSENERELQFLPKGQKYKDILKEFKL